MTTAEIVYKKACQLDEYRLHELADFADFLLHKPPQKSSLIPDWKQHLREMKGMWKDRPNLEETFEQIRSEFERDISLS